MDLWMFLHIVSMFAAVAFVASGALLATWAIRGRDLDGLRVYFRVAPRVDSIGGVLFVVGIIFGLITAMVSGFDLFSPWLIIAYVLVAIIIGIGAAMTPYLKRLKSALEANAGDSVGEDLEQQLRSPTAPLMATLLVGVIALIIADMVFKPGA